MKQIYRTQSNSPPSMMLKVAASVSLVLGCTGLIYWVPGLYVPQPDVAGAEHPVAFIQRVASLAVKQYTPTMGVLVPLLGGLFSLACALQIPAAIGSLRSREWALRLLRGVAYAKVALYILSGLLLGLAVFSSVQAGDPSWTFSAVTWVLNLAMIGIYYWIILAAGTALPHYELPESEPDSDLEDELLEEEEHLEERVTEDVIP